MNELQQFAVNAAKDLASDLIRTLDDPRRGSIQDRARSVVDQIDAELADMQSRSRLQGADGAVADDRAARIQRKLEEIGYELEGAVELGDDAYARALQAQRDALRIQLGGERSAGAVQRETEAALDDYISALQWLKREAIAELTGTVAMARAAEDRAAMANSYEATGNLRQAINGLRDDAVRAFSANRKRENQILEGDPDLAIGLHRERSREARYQAEIESIRRRQRGA
jgi:hypothetical protein